MTDYPYEPPSASSATPLLAFRDFELASTWVSASRTIRWGR